MTKTKRQLRAEAVERLKDARYHTLADYVRAMLGWGHEPHFEDCRDALIDLLEDDDMDSAVCVQKRPNDELPEGNAVVALRKWVSNHDPQLRGHGLSMLETIADMIERDYVSRAEYERATHDAQTLYLQVEAERDEWKVKANCIHDYEEGTSSNPFVKEWTCRKCGHETLIEPVQVERDEWKIKALDYEHKLNVELACSDKSIIEALESHNRELAKERDEWKAKAEQAQESYLDAKSDRDAWMEKAMDAHESCRQDADQGEHSETHDRESDSREKLEADVTVYLIDKVTTWSAERYALNEEVIRWLDRQAAITERHWMEIVGASANANVELKRQIDVLTEQLESAHAKNRALKAHVSKMQEGRHGWHVKAAKLQERVMALERERDDMRSRLGKVMDVLQEAQRAGDIP